MKSKETGYLTEDKTFKFLDRTLWVRLGKMLKGYKSRVFLAFGFLMGAELLPQFQPKLVKAVIDGPIQSAINPGSAIQNHSTVTEYITLFFILIVFTGIFKYFAAVISQTMALNIIHDFRIELFEKVQSYKTDFFKRTPVGRLMTRLTNDLDSLSSMFSEGFIDLAGAFLMLLFPVVFMLMENWRLALVTLTFVPFMIILTSIFRIKVREINKVIKKVLAEINTNMQENLSGSHVVQMFGQERQQWKEFNKRNKSLKEAWIKNVRYFSYYFPFIHGLTEFSIVGLYFFGGYWFFRDQVSLGTLMAFSMYMGMFWRPLREISDKYTQLQSSLASAERVFTLYDLGPVMEKGDCTSLESPITFDFSNVSFGYEKDQVVLDKVSFSVKEGESIAIVGATGSGKSTVLSLCNDFYRPHSGQVLLNHVPIQDYQRDFYHQLISYIPQDVYLYADTVAFNISLSNKPDMDRVKEVSAFVNAHSFVENLPSGYNTKLTVRGEDLSTGQRQLLAFARALYHRPKILLLDEATSSIDTDSENLIQDALKRLTKTMTTIVVAHRLSTIRTVDRIIVMHKGSIRESGNHTELLAQKGIYYKLYQLQESA